MKKSFTLLPLVLIIATAGSAQTRSRLAAQSLYNHNGVGFTITDTTAYQYTGKRGGDLNSRYLPYTNAISFRYDAAASALVNHSKSLQSFDINGNRSVRIGTQWNKTVGAWEDYETTYYYTTADDSLTSQIDQLWNKGGATWDNLAQQIITYDAAKNRNSYTLEYWKAGAWVGHERFFYTYDASNNLTGEMYQLWDATAGTWENNFSDTFTYTTGNKVLTYYNRIWDKATMMWVNNKARSYVYGPGDLLFARTESGWDAGAGSWYNVEKDSFYYDGRGNTIQEDRQTWNTGTGMWENKRRSVSVYDGSDRLRNNFSAIWDAGASLFIPGFQHTYTYDAAGNMLSDVLSNWNTGAAVWDSSIRYTYRYNSYNQKTYQNYEDWDNAASAWINKSGNQLFHYYYQEYDPTKIAHTAAYSKGKLLLYPIPAQDQLTVSLSWEQAQAFSARITDLQGRVYRQWSGPGTSQYQTSIPTGEMPAGMYFLECRGNKGDALKQSFTVKH